MISKINSNMHYQSYGEEEFEPRIIPKPTTKLDVSYFTNNSLFS